MLKRPRTARPLISREDYTLRQLKQVFPEGEWVDEQVREKEAEVAEAPGCDPGGRGFESLPSPSNDLTVIGDMKDLEPVYDAVGRLRPDRVILGRLPSARGAEANISKMLAACGWQGEVVHVDHDPDVFGKADCNVEQVLSYDLTSPVLLVGNGTRVKQARSWLKRAEWGREVIEVA